MASEQPLVIVGGGLAGCLAALMLFEQRPDLPVLLLEAGSHFGGNHTWSFFDTDIPEAARSLIAALCPARWSRNRVRFPNRERMFDQAYNAVSSDALDRLVRNRLPPARWRLGTPVAQISPKAVVLASGETIAACAVIDARGPDGPMPGMVLGWQNFVGIEFAASPPDPGCATIMDACLPQIDGYRFVYVLPLGPDRTLVEDTYYCNSPDLDVAAVSERVRGLAAERGLSGQELRVETGVLPILIGGDPARFWPLDDPVARLGLRGGFFHPTTGYSFGIALRLALDLVALGGDYNAAALARWSRAKFIAHWRRGRFFRLLNTMLFRAGEPDQRYKVFEHFYRLPADLIARFYSGQLTLADRAKILSGKPPVPLLGALRAMVG